MTDNIYFIPQYIGCPECGRMYNALEITHFAQSSKDKEYICECGNSIPYEYLAKFFGMIKDVKI